MSLFKSRKELLREKIREKRKKLDNLNSQLSKIAEDIKSANPEEAEKIERIIWRGNLNAMGNNTKSVEENQTLEKRMKHYTDDYREQLKILKLNNPDYSRTEPMKVEEDYIALWNDYNPENLIEPQKKETPEKTWVGGIIEKRLDDDKGRKHEYLDVVDEQNRVIGKATRDECHSRNLIHRDVYILLFNPDGKIFMKKRSYEKDLYKSMWEVSASGHVDSGESYETAAKRELAEELGVKNAALRKISEFRNFNETERQFSQLFTCDYAGNIHLNKKEATEGNFFSINGILSDFKTGKRRYTQSTKLAMSKYLKYIGPNKKNGVLGEEKLTGEDRWRKRKYNSPDPVNTMQALINELKDNNEWVRTKAVEKLREIKLSENEKQELFPIVYDLSIHDKVFQRLADLLLKEILSGNTNLLDKEKIEEMIKIIKGNQWYDIRTHLLDILRLFLMENNVKHLFGGAFFDLMTETINEADMKLDGSKMAEKIGGRSTLEKPRNFYMGQKENNIQYSDKYRLNLSDEYIINYFGKRKGIFIDIGIAAGKPPTGDDECVAIATRFLAKKMSKDCPNVKIIGIDITTKGLSPVLEQIRDKTRPDSKIQFIAPNLDYIKYDVVAVLPMRKNSVDVVREAHVFYPFGKIQKELALKHITDVLKENGLYISAVQDKIRIFKKKDNKLGYFKTMIYDQIEGMREKEEKIKDILEAIDQRKSITLAEGLVYAILGPPKSRKPISPKLRQFFKADSEAWRKSQEKKRTEQNILNALKEEAGELTQTAIYNKETDQEKAIERLKQIKDKTIIKRELLKFENQIRGNKEMSKYGGILNYLDNALGLNRIEAGNTDDDLTGAVAERQELRHEIRAAIEQTDRTIGKTEEVIRKLDDLE